MSDESTEASPSKVSKAKTLNWQQKPELVCGTCIDAGSYYKMTDSNGNTFNMPKAEFEKKYELV